MFKDTYKVTDLKYEYNALEPYIDERTVDLHYNKHTKGYLNNLIKLLDEAGYDYRYTMEELVTNIDEFPLESRARILFNAGGVLNHNLYWNNMSPNKNTTPVGSLAEQINKQFGSFEAFKEEFIKSANSIMGSGWTFLVIKGNGELGIINTSNQETPYLYGYTPILGLDVWEHSYYLKYQNLRPEYINNFFEIVDFEYVNSLYEQNKK